MFWASALRQSDTFLEINKPSTAQNKKKKNMLHIFVKPKETT